MLWWFNGEPCPGEIDHPAEADDFRPNEAVKKSQLGQVECVSEIKNFQDG
jgi:hypothetical protein